MLFYALISGRVQNSCCSYHNNVLQSLSLGLQSVLHKGLSLSQLICLHLAMKPLQVRSSDTSDELINLKLKTCERHTLFIKLKMLFKTSFNKSVSAWSFQYKYLMLASNRQIQFHANVSGYMVLFIHYMITISLIIISLHYFTNPPYFPL